MNEQRKHLDVNGEPSGHLRKMVAKDFGVVARFRNTASSDITEEGYLYDYFFAGIRGLGTWGATWFIDRKAKLLLNYPEEGNIQILVEVTYKDGGIVDVIDVSEQPAEYFRKQNSLEYIREQILAYKES